MARAKKAGTPAALPDPYAGMGGRYLRDPATGQRKLVARTGEASVQMDDFQEMKHDDADAQNGHSGQD